MVPGCRDRGTFMTIKLIILAAMYCIAVLGPRLAKQQA